MKTQLIGVLLLAGLGSVHSAQAQQPGAFAPAGSLAPAGTPAPFSAAAPPYKIAAGDVLSVNIANFPNDSVPQTVVTPDGMVSLPLVGQVAVAGQSVGQTMALLTAKYKTYIVRPVVSVSLVQKHPQIVVFSGSVNHPGTLDYRPGMHLLEALAEVGGLVTAGSAATGSVTTVGLQTAISDPSHVVVTHEDGTMQALNLTNPQTLAGTPTDIALEPGDVDYVPQQLGKISVIGEVKEPGVIPYREGTTILDAVSDAGSFNPDTADLANATLIHDGKTTQVNLDPLLRHGVTKENIVLDSGDQITIPELKNKTFVIGDVARPGYYLYKPGDRVLNALSGVDGPTPDADLGKINVIHTDPVTRQVQFVRVNLNEFLLKGNPKGNPLIQSGDSLYIPDKHKSLSASEILGAIQGVGSAVYTGRVLGVK